MANIYISDSCNENMQTCVFAVESCVVSDFVLGSRLTWELCRYAFGAPR